MAELTPYMTKFIGTMLLIILGDGVVADALLARTRGNILGGTTAGWIVITTG
jgi:hypothetical protein